MPNAMQPLSPKSLPFLLYHTFLSKAKTGEGMWKWTQAHDIKRKSTRAKKRTNKSHNEKNHERKHLLLQSYVPKLGLFRAKMLGWGKKDGQKERDESIPKSRGKA